MSVGGHRDGVVPDGRSPHAGAASWWIYRGTGRPLHDLALADVLPSPPPWRMFGGVPLPANDAPASDDDDKEAARRLGTQFNLSERDVDPHEVDMVNAALYLRRPLLVTGLPGTGKSSLARWLGVHAGFAVIRSDVVRKEHAQLSAADSNSTSARALLYSPEMTEQTYAECLRRAEELVFEGKRVIVDATFREEAQRRQFLDVARQWGLPCGMLLCQAHAAAVRERLVQRKGDASDADWSVYEALAATWEDPGERTQTETRIIDTGLPLDQAGTQAGSVLREWELLD